MLKLVKCLIRLFQYFCNLGTYTITDYALLASRSTSFNIFCLSITIKRISILKGNIKDISYPIVYLASRETASSNQYKRQNNNDDKQHPQPWSLICCIQQVLYYSTLKQIQWFMVPLYITNLTIPYDDCKLVPFCLYVEK